MQRKNFLKTLFGVAVSTPALTSMALTIPEPKVLPEVRNRLFTIKALFDTVRPLPIPDVSHEQAMESMRLAKQAGLVLYNSAKINQPSIQACWLIDSDGLLAEGDFIQQKALENSGQPWAWQVISAVAYGRKGFGKCQVIVARTYHMALLTNLPKMGDSFYILA